MADLIDRRMVLAGGVAAAARPAFAQDVVHIAIKTVKGVITAELYATKAPLTVKNFLRYVDMKLLDGATFYRVSHAPNAPDKGLIEGGLRGRKVLRPVAHESTAKTGLTHKDGTLSMARLAPGTATSEFFIVVGDQPGFDADPAEGGDPAGFAAFGQVTGGMDVIKTIFEQPVSKSAGAGVMKSEMLSPPVQITNVRRTA